jgi:hypothetical protein
MVYFAPLLRAFDDVGGGLNQNKSSDNLPVPHPELITREKAEEEKTSSGC